MSQGLVEVLRDSDSAVLFTWSGELPCKGDTFNEGGNTYDVNSVHHVAVTAGNVTRIKQTLVRVTVQP